MICKICGAEYDGERCPRCGFSEAQAFSPQQTFSPQRAEPQVKTPLSPKICPRCGNATNGSFCGMCGFNVASFLNAASPNTLDNNYQNFNPNKNNYTQPLNNYPQHRGKINKTPLIMGIIVSIFMLIAAFVTLSVLGQRITIQKPSSSYSSNTPFYNFDDSDEASSIAPADYMPNGVSAEEYSRLQTGMSYAQISSIIGGDSYAYRQEELDSEPCYAAIWPSEDKNSDAYVLIYFKDSVAVKIQAEGTLK